MIHVVTGANQHLYARQLDAMFRMRHAFYIEGHGWSGLTGVDGKETDEFDDEAAVYLMSIDPWGDVAASVRLNPTTGPTLLKKFSSWAIEPLPASEDCWDISRWIAAPSHRRGANPRWPSNHQRELVVGILEFCQSRGLSRLTMLAELRLAERIAAYGWPVRRLGEPRSYEGGKGVAVAAEIRVGPDVLALTRQKTGLLGQTMFEIDSVRAPMQPSDASTPSESLVELVNDIGAGSIRKLVRALAREIAGARIADRARAIELIAAINRLLETCGCDPDRRGRSARSSISATSAPESRVVDI